MSKTLEALAKARELMVASGWTKWNSAVDSLGNAVDFDDLSAVCFCATGALDRACSDLHVSPVDAESACAALLHALPAGYVSVVEFNDSQESAGPVLELFTLAIEAESK